MFVGSNESDKGHLEAYKSKALEAHMDGAVGKSSILTFAPNTKSSFEFKFKGLYYVA